MGWTNSNGSTGLDGWIVKINSSGAKQWELSLGGEHSDWFEDVAETSSGELLAVGTADSDNAWVVKVTGSGTKMWGFNYWYEAEEGFERAYGIERTPIGTYLIAGVEYIESEEHFDGITFEIDQAGEIEWFERYGHSMLDDWFYDVAVDESGQAYFVGYRNAVWNGTKSEYDFGDAWVHSINSSREVRWSRTLSPGDFNSFDSVDASSGEVLVAGSRRSRSGLEPDAFAAKFTESNTMEWNFSKGGSGVDDFDAAHIASDKAYYLGGETELLASGNRDAWLLRLGSDGPPPVGGGQVPKDLDGDGAFEDVNGDGKFSIVDVQLLFTQRNSDAVQNNADLFDFTGDGSFSIADVQQLFVEFASGA